MSSLILVLLVAIFLSVAVITATTMSYVLSSMSTERKRLKEILREIVPADAGVIIRTAAEGVSEEELARDVTRLQTQWAAIQEQAEKAKSEASGQPKTLYEEPDLLVKVVRDLFNDDFSKLVIEGDKSWRTVENYIRTVASDLLPRVEQYDNPGSVDVFAAHRIDEQLAKALDGKHFTSDASQHRCLIATSCADL